MLALLRRDAMKHIGVKATWLWQVMNNQRNEPPQGYTAY
jgi:hypothetical protein